MNNKAFASHADLAEKTISFERLSDNAYAYTAEGDPNSGVIIGDDSVMVVDATATPRHGAGPDPRPSEASPTSRSVMWCSPTTTRCACRAPRPTLRTAP